ncbi:MAG: acetate--CoA ligase family protein, partial [bacterium]
MLKTLFDIETILNPKSIAIVGLSSNTEHISYSLMENIVDNGYHGVVYPVNPKIKAIKGLKCYPKITDIPEEVDLAIIILKPESAIEVLEESAKIGIKNFIIIASGFAESGSSQQEEKIKELTYKYRLTVLGPNCVGIINTYQNLNASFATKGLPKKGTISIISQSGGFSIGIVKYLTKYNLGISKLISVGNKAVLQESHFMEYLINDDTTRIIAMYVEDIKDFEEFEEVAYKLLEKNKPIVVFKGGVTEEGEKASASHTAAITKTADYYKALFNKTGCIYVERIQELYFVISTLEKNQNILHERGKRVLIVSNCGGCGVINTDFAIKHGFEVKQTSQGLKEELRKILPPAAAIDNPIDIVGDADHHRLEKTLEVLIKFKNEYDYLIINMGQQSTINMEEVNKTIYNLSFTMQKENIVALSCMFALDVTQKEYSFLHQSNIPVFVYPEDLTSSLKYIHDYNNRRKNILSRKVNFQIEDLEIDWPKIKEIIKNDEKVNNYLSPLAVIQILKLIGLKIPKTQEYGAEEKEIDFPVVLKTASPSILHKTEFQGVYLNINSYQELHEKANKLKNLYPKVIIQKMIPNDIELILGARDRKLFLIGLGGIMVELL